MQVIKKYFFLIHLSDIITLKLQIMGDLHITYVILATVYKT